MKDKKERKGGKAEDGRYRCEDRRIIFPKHEASSNEYARRISRKSYSNLFEKKSKEKKDTFATYRLSIAVFLPRKSSEDGDRNDKDRPPFGERGDKRRIPRMPNDDAPALL